MGIYKGINRLIINIESKGIRVNPYTFILAGWATALSAITFRDETLFTDLGKIYVPTLILHGIHDKVCVFPLAIAQNRGIKNSKLIPFEYSGHALFWEERNKFNRELVQFIG